MSVPPEVQAWLDKAEKDLLAAERLAEGEPPLPDQVGFFCQQAAEKYLKAFLLARGHVPPRIHDIETLLDLCEEVEADFSQLRPAAEILTDFAVTFRYPDEWSSEAKALEALGWAIDLQAFVRSKLGLGG